MPGGNSRTTTFFDPYPYYLVRGEGARMWDADGGERIDFNTRTGTGVVHNGSVFSAPYYSLSVERMERVGASD